MRWLGLFAVSLCLMVTGCEQPVETVPSLSSGVTATVADDVAAAVEETKAEVAEVVGEAGAKTEEAKPTEEGAATAEAKPEEAKPAEEPKTEEAKPAEEAPKAEAASTKVPASFISTKLKVPTMSCPHGCWPVVKETLAGLPGVEDVQLSKQAKEDEIDNPVVELKVKSGFDAKAAIAALAKVDFKNAEVVK